MTTRKPLECWLSGSVAEVNFEPHPDPFFADKPFEFLMSWKGKNPGVEARMTADDLRDFKNMLARAERKARRMQAGGG